MPNEIKRFNLRMGMEVFDWYEEQAKKIGVPTSNYMIMMLAQHKQNIEGLTMAKTMPWEQMMQAVGGEADR